MSEREIQNEILERLLLIPGIFAWRANVGAIKRYGRFVRFGYVGQGDISGVLPNGRRLEIEVKTKDGVLSEEQIKFGQRINEAGGLWILARSADEAIARVKEALV